MSSPVVDKDNYVKDVSPIIYKITAVFLFFVFTFILIYKVTEIPTPFNVDEAGLAYDAVSLVDYHTDRFLYRFPVYFVNFGGGQNALYTYIASFFVFLFGYSPLIIRMPAIILSLLSVFVLSFSIRTEYGNRASLITIFFFTTLPFSIMHSRWGLESYLLFPMLIFSIIAFFYAVKKNKICFYLLSGVIFGITLYSYTVSYLLLPIFLVIVWLYLLYIHKIRWNHIIVMGIPLLIFAIPLILMLAVNNGFLDEIKTRFFSVPKFPFYRAHEISIQNILSHLKFGSSNIFYNLFVNDHCAYNIIPEFGSMYYITLPFIIFGCIFCFRKSWSDFRNKRFSLNFLMVILFCISFLISLLYENINANRACALYFPFIYFLAFGTYETLKKSKKNIVILAVSVYLVFFIFFIHCYFNEYPEIINGDSMFASVSDLENAISFADEVNFRKETVYILDSVQPYIYFLLAKQMDPYTFNEQMILSNDHFVKVIGNYRFRLDAVMPKCVYIINPSHQKEDEFESFGFDKKQFGSVVVYYPSAD